MYSTTMTSSLAVLVISMIFVIICSSQVHFVHAVEQQSVEQGQQPSGQDTENNNHNNNENNDNNVKVPIHVCYAPGTNLSEQVNLHERYDYFNGRWTSTASGSSDVKGQPVTLTWSIVPDGTMIPGGYGEPDSPCNLRSYLLSLFGSESAYMEMFNKAFASWSSIAGIRFIYEPNDDRTMTDLPGQIGVRGDIRISGHRIDGDYRVLAYTSSPNSGEMVIDTADIYFNQNKDWMFQAIAHELGHALGLSHSCPMTSTKLMEPLLATNYIGPQHDDILGAMSLYGDRLEPNNQHATASNLGSISTGTPKSVNTLSLHASNDQDFYRFSATVTGTITVVISPSGEMYTTGAVGTGGGEGACGGSFPSINTNQILNLQLEIYDGSTGGGLLAASNTGGLGVLESLTITVVAGKSYVVRVFTTSSVQNGSPTSVQMYSITVSTIGAPAPAVPAVSVSSSPSRTASRSISKSPSRSSAPSMTRTPSRSPAPSMTRTPSRSRAPSISRSRTPSPSKSRVPLSMTPSRSPAPSPSKAACGATFCI